MKGAFMDRIKFSNGHKYDLADGTSLGDIVIVHADLATLHADIMDGRNFKILTFLAYDPETEEEGVTAVYTDLILLEPAYHVNADESVTISLREKTDIEKRLDALEESQDIQDGAIADLAEVIGG
jgi:hypothetical protein